MDSVTRPAVVAFEDVSLSQEIPVRKTLSGVLVGKRVLAKFSPSGETQSGVLRGKAGKMSSSFDRRSFLTHSAATVGGIAMAGTVVDSLLSSAAGAAVGVNTGKPKLGGTLTVGILSDVPNYHIFNGSQGKMDASGFCVANALYDPLFIMSQRQDRPAHARALGDSQQQLHGLDDRTSPGRQVPQRGYFERHLVANYTAAAADQRSALRSSQSSNR